MIKVKKEQVAKDLAKDQNERFGLSITDGFYYVGTQEELEKIPVLIRRNKNHTYTSPSWELVCDFLRFLIEDAKKEAIKKSLDEKEKI